MLCVCRPYVTAQLSLSYLLLSIFPCAISPEALFSLSVSLGQQGVIPGSTSKEAQSSKSPSPGVMLEADPPAKPKEALFFKGALKYPLKHKTIYQVTSYSLSPRSKTRVNL